MRTTRSSGGESGSRFIAGFHGQSRRGFSTTIAFDRQQAIEAVERERPEVLILDSMMPKMTGFDVLHRIRALTNKPRVIVLSARGREQDVTRAFDLGADDYMMKPFQSAGAAGQNRRLLR